MKKRRVLLAVSLVFSIVAAYAMVNYYVLRMTGTIHKIGVEVYADDGISVLTKLDWGEVYISNTYSIFGFLKSISDVNSTVQYSTMNQPEFISFWIFYQTGYWSNQTWLSTSNWTDMAASPYLMLPNEWLRLEFRLGVHEDAPLGPFTFDIVIAISD